MSNKKIEQDPLHQEAEARHAHLKLQDTSARSAEELLHELRAHQIELDLQNEELQRAQLAIEESRDRYVDLYEFAPVGYLTLTQAGQISAINLNGAALLGKVRDKLLQDRFDHFVVPEDRDRWHRQFIVVLKRPEKSGMELALQRADGSTLHAHLDLLRTQTDPPEVRIALTDISAMKLNRQLQTAQDDLSEHLAFQASLLESVPVPIFFKDTQGCYLGCNRAYEESVGKNRKDIIGKNVFDLASPDIAARYAALDADLFDKPGKQVYESRIHKASGEIRDVVFHKASFMRNDGSVGGLIGAVLDITELKRKDAQLLEGKERLRLATETARDAIIMMEGENGTISAWNPAAESIFGYTNAEALGQGLHDLLAPPRFRETARHALSHFSGSGEGNVVGKTLELIALHKNGSEFPIELSLSAMKWHDKWSATGIVRDITVRKDMEIALSHANRALTTLGVVNRQLVYASNEAELLQSICQAIVEQSGYRMASVGYAQPDADKSIRIMARAGHGEGHPEALQLTWAENGDPSEPNGCTIRSGKTQVCQNIAADPDFSPWRDAALRQGYASCITLPLQNTDNSILGVLTVYSDEANTFIPGEILLLEEMAGDLAFGVRTLRMRQERDRALEQIQQHLIQMQGGLEDTVQAIASIVEMRDPYTAGHQFKVAELAAAIAKKMALSVEQVYAIHLAGVVHDLGKIRIPVEILSKPGRLDEIEYSLIKLHPQAGYDILHGIKFPWPIAQMILQHHERMDGSGYPQGLKGDAILLEARILAVADVVEAVSSHRPYRPALGMLAALKIIEQGSSTLFDAAVVAACIEVVREQDMKLLEKITS